MNTLVLDFKNNKYIYNYTDQLGNVRLSYQNNGSGAAVLEENNYYPFGLKHEGYNTSGNPDYRYQYNGKELQDDTGMLDYGWRQYMPELGRWNGMDPFAEQMRRYNPYNYAFNNPIGFIDPDGRLPVNLIERYGKNSVFNWAYDPTTTILGTAWYDGGYGSIMKFMYEDGSGGGGLFGNTQAYKDLMYVLNNGGSFSLKTHNGYMFWWTGGTAGNSNTAQEMVAHILKLGNILNTIGNFLKDHFIFEFEGKATLGVQGGFRTSFGTAEAGIMTGDIGKVGISTKKGLYAKYGDGKGHNFAGIGVGIKDLSTGIKADYVTDDWVPTPRDLLDYYPNNGGWDIEGNVGPRVNKGVSNGSLSPILGSKIKQMFRAGITEVCTSCIDMTFSMKLILGIDLRVRTGFTGF
ncbi:RHS repeat-associated core domain-containing protein [Chryseobacterium indologenes]|uniref:RHS repeat-associated core domain-containing protein n=1 Tax=Chryseobacterium indologenes TaxID=253 RepID=A0A0N1KRI0_CHRID|nr:hypothetical protein AOB46_22555 [Chryseobacterium indologenes]